MPLGIDDIFYALSAAAAANSIANPPKLPNSSRPGGIPGGTQANGGNDFGLQLPDTTPLPNSPITQNTNFLEPLAQMLAAAEAGGEPVVPLEAPSGNPGAKGPTKPEAKIKPKKASLNIGEILAASPEALTAVASLLGLGPQQADTVRAAPAPAGTSGSVIPGLQLPQVNDIGQLLAAIPRFR